MRHFMSVLKEYGILGNLIVAAILGLFGILVAKYGKYAALLDYSIQISLTIASLVGILLVLASGLYFIYKFHMNTPRLYGKVHGYYRTLYEKRHYPYLFDSRQTQYTHHKAINEYVICKDGITKLGPIFVFAFKPRGKTGIESVVDLKYFAHLNGKGECFKFDILKVADDEVRIDVRSITPLKRDDRVQIKLEFNQLGVNAFFQEELDYYIADLNQKQTFRNKLFREMNCEMVFATPGHASKYHISVTFPEAILGRLLSTSLILLICSFI